MTNSLAESDLEALAEESPAMLWRGDANGRCVYLNKAMRQFWGLKLQDCATFDWSTSLLPEDQGQVFGPFSTGMSEAQPFTCEGRYRRSDGVVRILRTKATPYQDCDGHFAGMVGVNEDITELRNAERSLSARNEELAASLAKLKSVADRFALATSISGLAMSEHDEALRYTWSHNVPNSLGKTPRELVGPQLGGPLEALLQRTLETSEKQAEELSFLMGDQRLWVDIQATPATLPDGRRGVVASALDVTSRKLNEAKLQVLARELGHRVKNVFSVVQAVIRQSAKATAVPRDFVDTVDARLLALARAQDALLNMSEDRFELSDLLRRQLSHLNRIDFDGPEVLLPGKLAPYLSLAVHELGTNAAKYGSLRRSRGSVALSWSQPEPDRLRISWAEVGDPLPPAELGANKPPRKGFGSQLLTKIFEAATGGSCQLSMEPEGLVWMATIDTALELSV